MNPLALLRMRDVKALLYGTIAGCNFVCRPTSEYISTILYYGKKVSDLH